MMARATVTRNGMPVYYVREAELTNFRRFASTSLPLARRFTLLIGKNASGKTSVLDALCVLLEQFIPDFPKAKPRTFLAEDVRELAFGEGRSIHFERQFPARLGIKSTFDGTPMECVIVRTSSRAGVNAPTPLTEYHAQVQSDIQAGQERILPVIAFYSLGRLTPSSKKTPLITRAGSRLEGYRSLFDAGTDFSRVLDWWKTEQYEELRHGDASSPIRTAIEALKACIPGVQDATYDFRLEDLILTINGTPEPFSHSSAGYRQFIAVVTDIARRASILNPFLGASEALRTVPGVVLLDEIDTHLHPEWQRRVVYDLLQTFPNMQFIATTHSPFIIQGMPPADGETSIVRLDDMTTIEPQEMSIEIAAEYVQGVSDVDRSFAWHKQSTGIRAALLKGEQNPNVAASELDKIIESEPLSPVSKALLEMKSIALSRRGKSKG